MTKRLASTALLGAVASIPASKLKAVSERRLQRAAETLWPPSEQQKQLVGADPTDHLHVVVVSILLGRGVRVPALPERFGAGGERSRRQR